LGKGKDMGKGWSRGGERTSKRGREHEREKGKGRGFCTLFMEHAVAYSCAWLSCRGHFRRACDDEAAATATDRWLLCWNVHIVGQSLTQSPGAPVTVTAAAPAGAVMQSGLPPGPPLTPGKWHGIYF